MTALWKSLFISCLLLHCFASLCFGQTTSCGSDGSLRYVCESTSTGPNFLDQPAVNGTNINTLLMDDSYTLQSTGFPFKFYGVVYSSIVIHANGFFSFNRTCCSSCALNCNNPGRVPAAGVG